MTNSIFLAHNRFGAPCGEEGIEAVAEWAGQVLLLLADNLDVIATYHGDSSWANLIESIGRRAKVRYDWQLDDEGGAND